MSDSQEALTPQEAMYNEALSAIQAGDRSRARDLLTRLLKTGQTSPQHWIWMSAVVETSKERVYCLREALRLDPQNEAARRGLMLIGALPPDPALVVPARLQKRNWQSKVAGIEGVVEEQAIPAPKAQFALIGAALFLVVGLVGFAIWGMRSQMNAPRPTPVVKMLSTKTAVLSSETTATSPVSVQGKPTALWMLLEATYTPTPLYVNTPHTVNEAYRIGLRAYQQGKWAEAEDYFQQVATTEPNAPDVLYYLAEISRQQGNDTQAAKSFTSIIDLSPNFAPAYVGRARTILNADPKNINIALKDLETAIKIDENYGEAYLELAAVHTRADNPEKALVILDQALTILPDSPMIYLYRAQAYLELGNTEEALENARQANQLDITLLPAYRMIGQALQAEGDLRSSLDSLDTYVHYSSEDAQAWLWLAKAYWANKNDIEALKALDRSLRLDNRQAEAYLLRAQLTEAQGSAEEAMDDYRAVLRMDSESFEASIGVGRTLMALEYPGDAYNQFERTMALAKKEIQKAEVIFWRAQSLETLGHTDVAMRDWQALVALPKENVEAAWVNMARARIAAMQKLTPSPKPKTPIPTVTVTFTRQPARTSTLTATKKP